MTTGSAHGVQRPSVVTVVGSSFLLVDDVAPRALVLDVATLSGRTVTWADRPPPREYTWPRRHVWADDERAHVVDGPGTVPVDLRLDGLGSVVVEDARRGRPRGDGVRVARNRFWSSWTLPARNGTWACRSSYDGVSVRAQVRWMPHGHDAARVYDLGPGGVAGAATNDDVLVVTVRRAHKRPWRFRPRYDAAVLWPGDPEPVWLPTGTAPPATG